MSPFVQSRNVPLPLCRWQAAPIALTPTYSGFGTEPRVRQLDLPRSKLHAHPAQPLRRPAAFGGDRSASPASRRPPSPQRTTGAQMEAVNERRGHRLVAEHGAIPRLVRGGRRGRPQRASSSWKVRRRPRLTGRWPISTTSCAGWASARRRRDSCPAAFARSSDSTSPARVPQWTRQPFPAAATGQSPRSPNLLRQETLEADGELAFTPRRAPPQRA